jgi:hypothetical protein
VRKKTGIIHRISRFIFANFQVQDNQGWEHIAYYKDVFSANHIWLTNGTWEIDQIMGSRDDVGIIYFTSTQVHSTQRHLYSVSISKGVDSKVKMTPPADITIKSLVPYLNYKRDEDITDIGFYSASFSPDCNYYTIAYMGPDIPFKMLYSTIDPKFVKAIVTRSEALGNLYANFAFPIKTIIEIPNESGDCKIYFLNFSDECSYDFTC